MTCLGQCVEVSPAEVIRCLVWHVTLPWLCTQQSCETRYIAVMSCDVSHWHNCCCCLLCHIDMTAVYLVCISCCSTKRCRPRPCSCPSPWGANGCGVSRRRESTQLHHGRGEGRGSSPGDKSAAGNKDRGRHPGRLTAFVTSPPSGCHLSGLLLRECVNTCSVNVLMMSVCAYVCVFECHVVSSWENACTSEQRSWAYRSSSVGFDIQSVRGKRHQTKPRCDCVVSSSCLQTTLAHPWSVITKLWVKHCVHNP